jgi:hypothetical protein
MFPDLKGVVIVESSPRVVVVLTVLGFAAIGCSSAPASVEDAVSTPAVPTSEAAAALGCAESAAPLLRLEPHSPQEPVLAIPQPSGWERTTELDSELIRGVIINAGLRADDFSPNAVATLEDLTGRVDNTHHALEVERSAITQAGMTIGTDEPATVCGHPSTTISYTLENRPVTALIVAAEHDGSIYAATLTVQTAEPDNPTYAHDKLNHL